MLWKRGRVFGLQVSGLGLGVVALLTSLMICKLYLKVIPHNIKIITTKQKQLKSMKSVHILSHVPECFKDDNASQWKSGKFDHRSLRNPWTDRHLNLHGWLRRGPLPLCKISRYDYSLLPPPQICENVYQVTWLVFLVLLSAYCEDPYTDFFNQYVKWHLFAQGYAFGSILGQFSTGLRKFRFKKALTMGMLTCKLPLIVIVDPRKLYSE